ncbi:dynein regulatory complex subunit 5 [Polypterus senegalus]
MAEFGDSVLEDLSASDQHTSFSMSRATADADKRKMRRIIAEDPDWSLAIVPYLRIICLQHIIDNFEKNPILDELPPADKVKVLEKLSTKLPISVTANLISDEGYWRRCSVERWGRRDVSYYGNSWRRMFLECHLESAIELFIPNTTDPNVILDKVPFYKNYVKKISVSQLLPPVKSSENRQKEDTLLAVGDGASEELSVSHFDFGMLLDKMTELEELHLVYGVRGCRMNFEWSLFEFTEQDCQSLAKALKSCKHLKVFRLHQSKVNDENVQTLCSSFLEHPSLRELDFSHNIIGERGARAIGKLLNSSKLEVLSLYDNKIKGHGAQAIAYALSRNENLTTLNLRLNRIGDEGGQCVANALLKNSTLINLHLGSNELTEPTANFLSRVLMQNKTLKSINLSCNRLGLDGGKQLQEGMAHNSSLVEFDLRLTEVGQESEYFISQILQRNKETAHRTPL